MRKNDPLVISAFAETSSTTELVRRLGVGHATIERWKHDPDLQAAVQEVREQMVESAVNAIRAKLTQLVENVLRIATDSCTAAQVRLNATQLAMNCFKDLSVNNDLSRRIATLEAAAESGGNDVFAEYRKTTESA